MPDWEALATGQSIALLLGVIALPVCQFYRHRQDRMRSEAGALGWAVVDAYNIWLIAAVTALGYWTAAGYAPNLSVAVVIFVAGPFIGVQLARITTPVLTRVIMRTLGG